MADPTVVFAAVVTVLAFGTVNRLRKRKQKPTRQQKAPPKPPKVRAKAKQLRRGTRKYG